MPLNINQSGQHNYNLLLARSHVVMKTLAIIRAHGTFPFGFEIEGGHFSCQFPTY